jgi:hypothetical protein
MTSHTSALEGDDIPRLGAEGGVAGPDPLGAGQPVGGGPIPFEALLDGRHQRGQHKAGIGRDRQVHRSQ